MPFPVFFESVRQYIYLPVPFFLDEALQILPLTFLKNIYISIYLSLIMKILTNFRKTVETGMDPCLHRVGLKRKEKQKGS